MQLKSLASLLGLVFLSSSAMATSAIERVPAPNDFPISTVVTVPSDAKTYYFSGVVPTKQEDGSYGDTKTQTVSVLKQIEINLIKQGLTLGDVVKMQVFLVADENKENKMDFAGFMEGYTQFFGTKEQPITPARSAFEISKLAFPGMLVEIEVTAAK